MQNGGADGDDEQAEVIAARLMFGAVLYRSDDVAKGIVKVGLLLMVLGD